jgi:hypothetical protein
MRTISTGFDTTSTERAERVRVSVKDSGGTFRDLTTYPGFNAVDSVKWTESVDDPHATAEITLTHGIDLASLAPLMTSSPLNRGFVPTTAYAPLLDLNRELTIEVSVDPEDQTSGGNYLAVFHGRIDTIDAGGDQISISCRDLGGKLADTFIETERAYSWAEVGGVAKSVRVWEPEMTLVLNEYVAPSETGRATRPNFYKVTTAGTGGVDEPVWPAAGTVADGTAVFTFQAALSTAGNPVEEIVQNMLDDNLGAGVVTLYTPVSPAWTIHQFKQDRTPLLDGIRKLAMQIGWDVRYKFRSGSGAFELTLFEPDRATVTSLATFAANRYTEIRRLALDKSGIRNVVRVIYSDRADLWADGTAKRKVVDVADDAVGASIDRYGRVFMEIAEDSNSNIDTDAEATRLANAALADLKDPIIEQDLSLAQSFPWVELGDLYTFTANNRHYTNDQLLAVCGYSHEARKGTVNTTLSTRGKPAIGVDRWLKLDSKAPNSKGNHALSLFQSTGGQSATLTEVVGGVRIAVDTSPDVSARVEDFEHHISTSASFTPSSSTLVARTKSRTVEIVGLIPGETYYHRMIPRTFSAEKIIQGQPSAEQAFVAGRAATGHLTAGPSWGRIPLNGGFESKSDPGATAGPDHWTATVGAWGTELVVKTDSSGVSGGRYIRVSGGEMVSAINSIVEGRLLRVSAVIKTISGAVSNFAVVSIVLLSEDGVTIIGGDSFTVDATSSVGSWVRRDVVVETGGARYAYVSVGASGTLVFDVDNVELTEIDAPASWGTTALTNSWVNFAGGWATWGYMIDSSGFCHLRGRIKNGTAANGTLLTTLPTFAWPEFASIHAVDSNGAHGVVSVNTNGQIILVSGGSATSLSLDGVSFLIAQ